MKKLKINKYILDATFILSLLFILYPGCHSSSVDVKITRSEGVVTVKTNYMGWACGEFSPQIVPVALLNALNPIPSIPGFPKTVIFTCKL